MINFEYSLVFITDAIWTLSWFFYVIGTLRLRQSLFPVRLLPLILTWEILALLQNVPWPWSINYYLWNIITPCNLYLAFRYARTDYVKSGKGLHFSLRVLGDMAIYAIIILLALRSFGLNIYYVLGGATNVFISLHFYLHFRKNKLINKWNLIPNALRILAGNAGTIAVFLTLGDNLSPEVIIIRSAIFLLDLLFVYSWIKAKE